MSNQSFRFKQFTVSQQRAAMKVGTDGVLLGAWTPVEGCGRILDIGTGTGLLALMCAQRNPLAIIDAVEIDDSAAGQASENFAQSPWHNRLAVHNADVREYAHRAKAQYDLVICNPPFFVDSLKAPDKSRNMARHDVHLPLCDLVSSIVLLLHEDGKCAVVLPPLQMTALTDLMSKRGFFATKILNIIPAPRKPLKRVLAFFQKNELDCQSETIIVETTGRHGYSDEYKQLTKDFYLAF